MIVQSAYPELGPIEVPDGCRVEQVPASSEDSAKTIVWAKKRSGEEYVLVKDSAFRDGRPSRRWRDEKGRIHRDEKSGPAIVDGFYQEYFKHGKRHRVGGPQLVNGSNGFEVYCLEGQELSRALWESRVKNNGGRPPKACKGSIDALKSAAAELGAEAKRLGRVNGMAIPDELHELDEAAKPENWKRHGQPELRSDGNSLVCLDCDPLDDTLRCYIVIAKDGATILEARLEIE
jgi:hypothetical protein